MINPSRIIGAIGLTGGSGKTLDSFPSNMMKNGDSAIVIDGTNVVFYVCDTDSGEEENTPYVIVPDDVERSVNPELNNKRWVMVSPKYFNDDIIQSLNKHIQTSKIKAIDGQPIDFISSNGNIISISSNGTLNVNKAIFNEQITVNTNQRRPPFVVDSDIKVDKLNADKLDGHHASDFIKKDGSVPFTNPVQGVDPINGNDLTTVNWVENYIVQIQNTIYSYIDNAIAAIDVNVDLSHLESQINNHLGTSSDDHTQYIHIDGRRNFINPVGGVTPVLSNHFTTKGYVDSAISSITSNHNDLTNLSDDDHIQYVHIDSRRGFDNPVIGQTPIEDFHLATKEYVDEKINNIFNTKKLQIHTFDHNSDQWVINHNFGNKFIVVDFYNKFDNKQIYPDKLILSNSNTAIAEFSGPVNGYAVVNGIIESFNMTSNQTWIVNHSFDRNAIFNIFDENDEEIFPDVTTIIDDHNIAFTFTEPKIGTAVLSNDITVYEFLTPSLEWSVFHTYNNKNLIANCFNSDNHEIIPKNVEATDDNTLLVTFEEYESGYVIVSGSEAVILDPGLFIIDHAQLRGLDNDDHNQYPHLDGRRGFTGNITGIYPSNNNHLVTKEYVDDEITNVISGLSMDHNDLNGLDNDDHIQYTLADGTRDFTGPVKGITPTNAFHLTTKQYVDALFNASTSQTQRGVKNLVNGTDNITVHLSDPLTNYSVEISIENTTDIEPSIYNYVIIRKTNTEFDILFSGYIDSSNYKLNWVAYPLN